MLLNIAWRSLLHRKTTALLTIFSIAVSVMIVLSIEHIRQQTKSSFTSTLSGTDLIIGARSGRINLLLYSVFRIGNATNNISWESYQKIAQQRDVKWAIPLSLGDSHEGYRVLGTNKGYFTHYRYGQKKSLVFKEGQAFTQVYDAVIGANVAKTLGYTLGQKITLSHGITKVSFNQHDDKPFTIVGILAPTGTPVDQTIHTSLAGIEAIHIDWKNGAPITGVNISAEEALKQDLTPQTITAALIGLNNRIMTFRLQRNINQYKGEALMAILPGIALSELWQTMDIIEKVLSLIATLVVAASLLGMMSIVLATLQQRQREVSILRAIGAPTWFICCLIELEVLISCIVGILLALILLWLSLMIAQPILLQTYGLAIGSNPFSFSTLQYSGLIIIVALLMGLLPAWLAYRQSLAQGLIVKE